MDAVSAVRRLVAFALVATLACVAAALVPASRVRAQQPNDFRLIAPLEVQKMLVQMSGGGSEALATTLGVASIAGKRRGSGARSGEKAPEGDDVPIATSAREENEPTVAVNPANKKYLVAGSHLYPVGGQVRCAAYRSTDGGASWSSAVLVPQLTPASNCSDPVIAYAPDGNRVYYAHMDVKDVQDNSGFPGVIYIESNWDIIVSYSDDNGATWSAPVIALDGDPYTVRYTRCGPSDYCGTLIEPGFAYDKPWIGTPHDAAESAWVYVTSSRFDAPGPVRISFARSSNKGASYGAAQVLESGDDVVVVQGSRPTGGAGGDVLVAWYSSGADGWLNGSFRIRTRYSTNHGAAWNAALTAAQDTSELPFWLGPHTFYKRWWGSMFPDVEIDGDGLAHLVYTRDPVANGICTEGTLVLYQCSSNAEDGDIRYGFSAGPPYNVWSAPATVNDDGLNRAQGYAALKVQFGSAGSSIHVIWEDTRLTPEVPPSSLSDCFLSATPVCNSSNLYYDIFYATLQPGVGSSANARVTDVSSIQDYIFTGDYTDMAASANQAFAVWTDRRRQTSIFAFQDNVYGSVVGK
jgi:hypothetical protein